MVVQSADLMLSTLVVAPTSRSAPPRVFRPTISVAGEQTQVLTEQTVAVAHERLGPLVGHVSFAEMQEIDVALRLALALD